MLTLTLADLAFRARQFLIAVFGAAVVLGVAVVITGLSAGFRAEVQNTVDALGADAFVIPRSADARLTVFDVFPQNAVDALATAPGVRRASPLLIVPTQVGRTRSGTVMVNLVGVVRGGLGDPQDVARGHPLAGEGQVVVDDRLEAGIGTRLVFAGKPFVVVGTVGDSTLLGGTPNVFMELPAAQALTVDGRQLVTAVLTLGHPAAVPRGLEAVPPSRVVDSTVAQVRPAVDSMSNTRWLMWGVAVIIVAALLYVMALERRRDFAVVKALGASTVTLVTGVVIEGIVVMLIAGLLAIALSFAISPVMKQIVAVPLSAYITLPLISMAIGLLASVAALRQVASADPASAFS